MTEVVQSHPPCNRYRGRNQRAASSEQSTGVGQVARPSRQMDQATQQNAALVEQSAAVADSPAFAGRATGAGHVRVPTPARAAQCVRAVTGRRGHGRALRRSAQRAGSPGAAPDRQQPGIGRAALRGGVAPQKPVYDLFMGHAALQEASSRNDLHPAVGIHRRRAGYGCSCRSPAPLAAWCRGQPASLLIAHHQRVQVQCPGLRRFSAGARSGFCA